MSPEALARLRESLGHPFYREGKATDVRTDDLRALLDAYDKALLALEQVVDNARGVNLRGLSHLTALHQSMDSADAVLSKAGRR